MKDWKSKMISWKTWKTTGIKTFRFHSLGVSISASTSLVSTLSISCSTARSTCAKAGWNKNKKNMWFFEKGSAKIMQDLSDNDPWNPSSFLIENMFQPKDASAWSSACSSSRASKPHNQKNLHLEETCFAFSSEFRWFHEKHGNIARLVLPMPQQIFSQICWRLESWRIQLSPPRIEGKLWKRRENQRQALKVCKIPKVSIDFSLSGLGAMLCDADVNDMEVDAKWCDDPPNCTGFTGFWRPCLRLLRQEASKTYQTLHRIAGGLEAEKEQTANTHSTQELLTNWQT